MRVWMNQNSTQRVHDTEGNKGSKIGRKKTKDYFDTLILYPFVVPVFGFALRPAISIAGLRHCAARANQKGVGAFVIRSIRQFRRGQRGVKILMKTQSYLVDLLPIHFAAFDRQQEFSPVADVY